ncbi:MAG: DUF2207 domain-containing protein [Candidatus Berkelbacteria bacterium]|nr:DUF2207 domain-containing protein [Candidatus Berkelbacteria bacterium]
MKSATKVLTPAHQDSKLSKEAPREKLAKFSQLFFVALIAFVFCIPSFSKARDVNNITDWYIKDFEENIIVNDDTSLLVTEKIVADCGNLPDKHGIYRDIPTSYKLDDGSQIDTPIININITNENGRKINYEQDYTDNYTELKIGDADVTVKGVNTYIISYKVRKNAVRLSNTNYDEFYWNLLGNKWKLEIDNFSGRITFPASVNQNNAEISYYTGIEGSKDRSLANYNWESGNILNFTSTGTFKAGEGVTVSVTTPKGIFHQAPLTWQEKTDTPLGSALFILLPLAAIMLWIFFGRDSKPWKPIVAEYEPPIGLLPIELGSFWRNGRIKGDDLSAEIIKLAVDGVITIHEIPKKGIFSSKDFELTLNSDKTDTTKSIDRQIADSLFKGNNTVKLSDLANDFFVSFRSIQSSTKNNLITKNLLDKSGFKWQVGFVIISVLLIVLSFFGAVSNEMYVTFFALLIGGLIFLILSFLMPRRTKEGAEIYLQAKGFRLYMDKAEKYRQQFNDKENIFEKLLPYAMVFGLTKVWINNMKKIYGDDYFSSYHPIWYYGSIANFDADSFASSISSISSGISSSSGASGGGFSGGGGGGGGGGGW